MLESEDEIEKLQELKAWANASSFPELQVKLAKIEDEITSLKLQMKKEKKNIELKMKEGF